MGKANTIHDMYPYILKLICSQQLEPKDVCSKTKLQLLLELKIIHNDRTSYLEPTKTKLHLFDDGDYKGEI